MSFQNHPSQESPMDLITKGEFPADIKARLSSLKNRAAQSSEVTQFVPAPVWKPKFGDCLAGVFIGSQQCSDPGQYAEPHIEDRQILIQEDTGRVYAIWMTPDLRKQLSGGMEIGNLVAITFLGVRFSKDNLPFKAYHLIKDKLSSAQLASLDLRGLLR